jgi:cytochrome c oxidase subunit I+III
VTAVYFLIIGGVIAGLIRGQLAIPNGNIFDPFQYGQAVTLHGLIMILWFISPLAVGLANYVVPLQIGAKDLAFPRLNATSYWLFLTSGILLVGSVFLPGGSANTGWTLYAPLNTLEFSPQPGATLVILALAMLSASVTISSVNFITTIVKNRAKGVTWSKLPIFTWSILMTNALMLFAFPPLAAGTVLLTSDRILGTVFFSSLQGGAILWDQLFWFFGHPEVYIVVLPAIGVMAEVISTFTKHPLFARKLFIFELAAVTFLSVGVWVHHMFMTGISFDVREAFAISTMIISIPFEGLVINLVLTLRKSKISLTTPMLYVLGAIFFVILGGITGVFQAFIVLDYAFRGTYWVVGHFHYVMVGTAIFALIAALYYWWPKITKLKYNEKWGKITFAVSFIGFNVLYFPYLLLADMPRRILAYPANPEWLPSNLTATIGALVFGPAILIALANLLFSYRKAKPCEPNPWGATENEWTENYREQTTVNSAEHQKKSDVQPSEEKYSEKDKSTYTPAVVAAGTAVFMFGIAFFWPFMAGGLIIVCLAVANFFKAGIQEKFAVPEEKENEEYPLAQVPKEKLGVWIFITSEILIFGSFITAYLYVRLTSTTWPAAQTHDLTIGTVNTLLLLTSSLTIILALNSIRTGNVKGLKTGLAATFAFGAAFLALKLGVEWPQLYLNGFTVNSGLPASSYYVLTGAHAVHLAVGMVAIGYLLTRTVKGGFTSKKYSAVENIGLYWHFVDVVWMFLFPLFYLI